MTDWSAELRGQCYGMNRWGDDGWRAGLRDTVTQPRHLSDILAEQPREHVEQFVAFCRLKRQSDPDRYAPRLWEAQRFLGVPLDD